MEGQQTVYNPLEPIGQEILASKYLSMACVTILIYEYCVMFFDEVRYAWGGRKTWVFFLFCMNRYLPIIYMVWDLSFDRGYQFSQLLFWTAGEITSYCSVSTFVENVYLVGVTLLSQMFLAMRVYAVRGRGKGAFAILSTMTVIQLAYGLMYIIYFKREAYTYVPLFDPQEQTFGTCLQNPLGTSLQLGFVAFSLAFDVVAFFMIAVFSYKSEQILRTSNLFGRVVTDATIYFLVIVWSHLTILIYLSTMGDSRIFMLFPALTNILIPVMICRLVLSLRKATDPAVVKAWNIDHFSTQSESYTPSRLGGVAMSPMRFRRSTPTVPSSGRVTESDVILVFPSNAVLKSPAVSEWTVESTAETGEYSPREHEHRIS